MRSLLLASILALGACHSASDMHRDLERLCSADSVAHMTGMATWGPWYEADLHSAEMKKTLLMVKAGSLDINAFLKFVDIQLAAEKIDSCPGVDRLRAPVPPAAPPAP